jgi:DNA-binding transcriptional MerR regulator
MVKGRKCENDLYDCSWSKSPNARLAALMFWRTTQVGLLPAPSRTSSGYRSYDPDVLPRLKFIRAAQAVGLPMTDIREILRIRDSGSAPCRHVVSLLEQRRAEVAAPHS